MKHSTVRFKPSSEYSIFTLLELVGLRALLGTKLHEAEIGAIRAEPRLVKTAKEEVLLPISVLGRVANRQGWHFQRGYT